MSNKKKKKSRIKARRKRDKEELEKRIEEEQKRLLKKLKKAKKKPEQKKQKKEKELSDKLKIRKKGNEDWKESIHRRIDYHRFLEQQQRKLDYAAMFNYLGNLKKPSYEYSDGSPEIIDIVYRKNETIPWGEIKEFTDEWKMDQICNINRSFETSEKRDAYHWWKYMNPGMAHFLYELSLT